MAKNNKTWLVILTLFFFSGFCSLLYEITWIRLISLTLGNSAEAVAATLVAVMVGMAAGGYIGGKVADGLSNPLRLYGLAEGLVGLYALALPALIRLSRPLLAYFYRDGQAAGHLIMILARFAVCLAVLFIPTALFGAMFPLLGRFFARQLGQLGSLVGRLYGLNLLGATLGSLLSGLWLIPNLGLSKSIYLAAGIEFLICGWVLAISSKKPEESVAAEEAAASPAAWAANSRHAKLILLAMALSGASALIYEITWTRAIVMIVGSTTYAFSLMLTAILAGLAIGSLCASRLIDQRGDLVLIFGLLEVALGGVALSLTPCFEKLALATIPIFNLFGGSFAALQTIELIGLFFLMFFPSLLLGAIFPLMSKMYVRSLDHVGGGLGSMLMANSLGAAAGALFCGLVLISAVGIQKTMLVASGVNLFLGLSALLFSPSLSGVKKSVAIPLAFGCSLIFFATQPEWNKALVSAGPYIYGRVYASLSRGVSQNLKEIVQSQADLLFYQEDAQTTVSVKKDKFKQLFLQQNGKTDSASREDECTQRLLAHIPMLLHANPQRVMVLGLGSGTTLGAAEKYPIKQLDCLEISPAVLRACSRFFAEVNGHSLDDPRLRIIIGDGRQHLTLTDQKYDLIISQPSSPWIAGMSDLLTREFFKLCRERLTDFGLCCIWLQTCNLDLASSKSVVKAFGQIFPSISVWEARPGIDYLLIGSGHELKLDYQLIEQKMADESLKAELKAVGLGRPADLVARFVMSTEGAIRYSQGAFAHTDDNLRLEFQAPKFLYQETISAHLEAQNAWRGSDIASILSVSSAEAASLIKDSLPKAFEAQKHYALAEMYLLRNMQEEGARELKEAYLLDPEDTRIKERYYRLLLSAASNCSFKGMHEMAAQILKSAIKVKPDGFEGYLNLGLAYFHSGQIQAAIQQFRQVLLIQPDNDQAHLNLGACYLRAGYIEEAIQENLAALKIKPDLANAHFNLGIAYMRLNRVAQAIAEYQEAIKYQPDYAEAHFNLGIAYQTSGAWDQAAREYQEALRLRPDLPNVRQLLDQVQAILKQGS